MQNIAVIGAGSWGTALASVLASKNFNVKLWARRPELANEINNQKTNMHYLPDVKLADNLLASSDLEEVLLNAEMVVFSVPAQQLRNVLEFSATYIPKNALIVNTAKGIEVSSLKRLSEVMRQVFPEMNPKKITILSGPSHAEEVARKLPTAVVVAGNDKESALLVQDAFITPRFRVYTNKDIIGVELAGALKNIIALGTGISDGLGFGDNAKAALMTRGLAEISRLGMRLGANPLTFAGLAGVGDLIVTCTSMHSRNRRAGIQLGEGKPLEKILADMGMVVEGVQTCIAANKLSQQLEVDMPITSTIYAVLYENLNPLEAVSGLMERTKTEEST